MEDKNPVPKLLTKRELEIVKLVVEKEYSNKQIAAELEISQGTVETHMKHIYRKTNAHSKVGVIKYAYKEQLFNQ